MVSCLEALSIQPCLHRPSCCQLCDRQGTVKDGGWCVKCMCRRSCKRPASVTERIGGQKNTNLSLLRTLRGTRKGDALGHRDVTARLPARSRTIHVMSAPKSCLASICSHAVLALSNLHRSALGYLCFTVLHRVDPEAPNATPPKKCRLNIFVLKYAVDWT